MANTTTNIPAHDQTENERYVLDVEDVRELEQRIAASGTSLLELMRNAGAQLARAVQERPTDLKRICVLAGSGNNGGDGWVAAELLARDGYTVSLVSKTPANALRAEPAKTAARAATEAATFTIALNPTEEALAEILGQSDIVIDAILGTGFNGSSINEPYASWIRTLNKLRSENGCPFVVAADVPSGVSAQTGTTSQPHLNADETVTMIVGKPGLYLQPGAQACGTVSIARLCDLAPFKDYLRTHTK